MISTNIIIFGIFVVFLLVAGHKTGQGVKNIQKGMKYTKRGTGGVLKLLFFLGISIYILHLFGYIPL
jgi:uncharacterized membrane protein YtjA (UPF0391 family)